MNIVSIVINLFVFVIGPAWIAFFLRKRRPGSLWLGVALCLLFPVFGHFYLKGAATYVILVFVCALILYKLSIVGLLMWICCGLISAALMYNRFRARARSSAPE